MPEGADPSGMRATRNHAAYSAGTKSSVSAVATSSPVVLAWFSGHYTTARGRSRFSDLFVYGFTAAGLLYAVRFWTTGVF